MSFHGVEDEEKTNAFLNGEGLLFCLELDGRFLYLICLACNLIREERYALLQTLIIPFFKK